MLDHLHRHAELPPDFDELAGELRVAALMTPTPQPSAARRAELRAAVLARKNERSRAGVGGFRGVAMGVAIAAGGGMVIASAAGGGNPATFVAEVVREIPGPISRPEPRERPTPAPAEDSAARPADAPATPLAEAATPEPTRSAAFAMPATPDTSRDAATPTPTAAPAIRPSNTDQKPTGDQPSVAAADPVGLAQPTSTPAAATRVDPALSNAAAISSRTPTPTSTPTPAPTKPAGDPAPAGNAWPAAPTAATPTPTPARSAETSNTLEPLAADKNETYDIDSDASTN